MDIYIYIYIAEWADFGLNIQDVRVVEMHIYMYMLPMCNKYI